MQSVTRSRLTVIPRSWQRPSADSGPGSLRQAILDADAWRRPQHDCTRHHYRQRCCRQRDRRAELRHGPGHITSAPPPPPITLWPGSHRLLYSQPGATPNSNGPTQAPNTVFKIDLDAPRPPSNAVGLQLLANTCAASRLTRATSTTTGVFRHLHRRQRRHRQRLLPGHRHHRHDRSKGMQRADIYGRTRQPSATGCSGDRNVNIAACANGTFTDGCLHKRGVGVFIGGDSSATSVQGKLIGLAATARLPAHQRRHPGSHLTTPAPVSTLHDVIKDAGTKVVSGNSSAGIEVDADLGLLPIEGTGGTDVSGMNAVGNAGVRHSPRLRPAGVLIGINTARSAGNVILPTTGGFQLTRATRSRATYWHRDADVALIWATPAAS